VSSPLLSIPDPDWLWNEIASEAVAAAAGAKLLLGTVRTVSGGSVTVDPITTDTTTVDGGQPMKCLRGVYPQVGDLAVYARTVGSEPVVLGVAATGADTDPEDLPFAPANDGRGLVFVDAMQGTAGVNPTNSNTSNPLDIFADPFTLPSGTWDGVLLGTCLFSNSSATGGANVRFRLPGVSATQFGLAGVASGRFTVPFRAVFSNQSGGTFNVAAEYWARTAGTASAHAWTCQVTAVRRP
jgi:hypothetical protein